MKFALIKNQTLQTILMFLFSIITQKSPSTCRDPPALPAGLHRASVPARANDILLTFNRCSNDINLHLLFLLPVCPPPLTDFTQLNGKIIWIIEQLILTHLLKNQPHVIRKILFHRMRIANKSKVYLSYHYFFDLWSLSF